MTAETPPPRWWESPVPTLGALAIVGGALGWWFMSPSGKLASDARAALEHELLDADSAKLRNLQRRGISGVCGEVNAKNAFGAYVGFRQFHASAGGALIADDDPSSLISQAVAGLCEKNDT